MNPFKRQETTPCVACRQQTSDRAFPCEHCGERFCVVCGDDIPPYAPYCKECQSYQSGVRRFFSVSNTTLAWLTAFLALISTVVSGGSRILDRESQTGFKVTGAKVGRIHIQAWNSGREPSTLLNYELEIDDHANVEVCESKLILTPASQTDKQPAQQVEKRIIIQRGPPQKIDLGPMVNFKTKACTPSDDPCIQRIRDQLQGRTFTMRIQVQESSHWWNFTPYLSTKNDQEVPGEVIADFFIGACCEISE